MKGIFEPPAGGSPFGHVTFSSETFDREYESPKNLYTFVLMSGGITPENTAKLETALKDFPNAKAQTREEFVDNQISGLNSILNILYVLLALSVIVSLFGIVNTLVLTVFERTRELGMLRAIGMTRRQVRRMIRHESVITALIGGVLGIILGVVLGALLIARVDFIEFSLPTSQIITFAIATIVVGILAAIFPARRAARLDPLEGAPVRIARDRAEPRSGRRRSRSSIFAASTSCSRHLSCSLGDGFTRPSSCVDCRRSDSCSPVSSGSRGWRRGAAPE